MGIKHRHYGHIITSREIYYTNLESISIITSRQIYYTNLESVSIITSREIYYKKLESISAIISRQGQHYPGKCFHHYF